MRIKRALIKRRRKKKIFKFARGYYGAKSKLLRIAASSVRRALVSAYRDRRKKKRDFRSLWISRINAAARQAGISYAHFLKRIKEMGILLNRKMLADLAVNDEGALSYLVGVVKENA